MLKTYNSITLKPREWNNPLIVASINGAIGISASVDCFFNGTIELWSSNVDASMRLRLDNVVARRGGNRGHLMTYLQLTVSQGFRLQKQTYLLKKLVTVFVLQKQTYSSCWGALRKCFPNCSSDEPSKIVNPSLQTRHKVSQLSFLITTSTPEKR